MRWTLSILFIVLLGLALAYAEEAPKEKEIVIDTGKVKKGIKKGAEKTEKGVTKTVEKTGKALEKAGKKIKEHVIIEKDEKKSE